MYTVREPGKTGGKSYMTIIVAKVMANAWHRDTGIKCDIIRDYDGAVIDWQPWKATKPCVSR